MGADDDSNIEQREKWACGKSQQNSQLIAWVAMGSFGTRIALLSDPELGQGVGLHGLPRWH